MAGRWVGDSDGHWVDVWEFLWGRLRVVKWVAWRAGQTAACSVARWVSKLVVWMAVTKVVARVSLLVVWMADGRVEMWAAVWAVGMGAWWVYM